MSFGDPEYDPFLDAWKCEICGKYLRSLSNHVKTIHKISLNKYRKLFGFNKSFTFLGIDAIEKMRKSNKEKNKIQYIKEVRHLTTVKKGEKRASGKRRQQFKNTLGKKEYKPIKAWGDTDDGFDLDEI